MDGMLVIYYDNPIDVILVHCLDNPIILVFVTRNDEHHERTCPLTWTTWSTILTPLSRHRSHFVPLHPSSKCHRLRYMTSQKILDHLELFKTLMHLQAVPNEIMYKAFPTTLKGPARAWFRNITLNSISTFKELSGHFIMHFIGRKIYKRSSTSLLNIKQCEDESLRSYVARFNKEALLINEANDKVLVTTFTNGLCSREFFFSIYKNDLKTMTDMLYRATKYMNVNDAMIARGSKIKKRERQDNPLLDGQALVEDNSGPEGQALVKDNEPSKSNRKTSLLGDRIK